MRNKFFCAKKRRKFSIFAMHTQAKRVIKLFSQRLAVTLWGRADFTRFILLSRSRTGSNMLASLLNSHPHVQVDGEVLRRLAGQDHRDILAAVFAKQPRHIQAKGFKFFYYHPLDGNPAEVWQSLVNIPELRVIYLKRRNILRTLVSRKIAGDQGVWLEKTNDSRDKTAKNSVLFTVEELKSGFEKTRNWENIAEETFSRHAYLSIYYEDIVAEIQDSSQRISQFLSVPFLPPQIALRRQNPEALRMLISNYDQMKTAFMDTEWQSFFSE